MKAKYFCEKCGNEYETAEAAQWCEDSHGEVIETHVMPGQVYGRQLIYPDIVYVKLRNKNGQEAAGRYKFVRCENKDFEIVNKIAKSIHMLNFKDMWKGE